MQKSVKLKRPRALQACEICRARKNRCSEHRPCTYCVEHDLECTYALRENADKRLRPTEALANAENLPDLSSRLTPAAQLVRPDEPQDEMTMDENTSGPSTVTPRSAATDVLDTNLYTSNLEFYGSASSVAFLRHVETLSNSKQPQPSLASLLHNTDFQPNGLQSLTATAPEVNANYDRFYFRVAQRFLDAYFSNIHYIQPLFDQEDFLTRCEHLWFNKAAKQPLSFVAVYYATLSLGSLVMTLETPDLFGADRFTWSRKLFNDALAIVTRLGTTTDIEMVQCFYLLGKICQHELNPHVAYLYSGQAARTALAIGINRKPACPDKAGPRISMMASKTWWAVYCLDIQTSFALGRPDSLGPDQYHTQSLPTSITGASTTDAQLLHIVPCMVGLSRIMRKVGLDLYTQPCDMQEKLERAKALDAELEGWLEHVPSHLHSEHTSGSSPLRPRGRAAGYSKRQAVVLRLRYLNLRMIIHAVSMTDAESLEPPDQPSLHDFQCRCIQSAEDAIDLIHSTFCTDSYFQTWWYNSTYALFAVSILLVVIFRQLATSQQALEKRFVHIDRAVEILQAMDDCLVARNATAIVKRTLARARMVPQLALARSDPMLLEKLISSDSQPSIDLRRQTQSDEFNALFASETTNLRNLDEAADDIDWLNSYSLDDNTQALFWTEWAHELDTLGT